jgi:diguanylate cyclase (GGDEF)-like protein
MLVRTLWSLKAIRPAADHLQVDGVSPLGRFGRELAPFCAAALLAFVLVGLTEDVRVGRFAAAAALALVVVGMGAWTRRSGASRAMRVVPSLLFLVSASLLRDAGGGVASGVGVVALLPVFWLALHGDARQLAVVLAGVAAYYLVPVVLVGGAAYPSSGYRTGVLFVVISGIIGFTVQRLVGQVREHAEHADRHMLDLEHVTAMGRQIMASPDARVDVCRAVCEISGAAFAVLLEPEAEDRLRSTAMAGIDAPPFGSAAPGERSATRTALTTRRPIFVADPAAADIVNQALWVEHGSPACMRFEPVLREDAVAGVLVIGWAEPVGQAQHAAVIGLLATEAAIAIERADLVQQLSNLAMTDPLTGADNRRGGDAQLNRLLASSRDQPRSVSVAMLDLDHFKAFNDARGHQAGDRLLREAVAAWRSVLRPGDRLARYGGEEFVVVLPDCSSESATAVIDRLLAATPGGQTCSAGIAVWDRAERPDALLARADAALYAAKAAGRDRSVVAP